MIEIKSWSIDQALKKEINEHYRTRFALSLKDCPIDDIFKKITFDSVAPNITIENVRDFVEYVNRKFLHSRIGGVGLEVGGGCGFFTALFANYTQVNKFYSVEICENIVKELMPKVVHEVAGQNENKVIGCIGDFDNIELPDNSVDFIFDFYSLHHSSDIKKTFKELNRVLKSGGFVICFDKTRANDLTDKDLENLLDQEYSKDAKIAMGLSPDTHHTRRMNGEKEYRLKDWQNAFLDAGFSSCLHYHIARLPKMNSISGFIKNLISFLPISPQTFITSIIARGGNMNNLEQTHKIYTKLVNNFPKEISLLIAWK